MTTTKELLASIGVFSFILALMVLSLGQPLFSKTKSEVTAWYGTSSFLLGWLIFFLGMFFSKKAREPVSDYFGFFSFFVSITCWLIGLYCGLRTRHLFRGKMAVLLNAAVLALMAFIMVHSVVFPPTR